MTIIDPSTSLGKIRLRIGDWSDLPILSDAVITSALTDCQSSVPRASALCAQYILATLAFKTHRKLAQLETWSSEQFKQYKEFLQATIKNPHMMETSPIPYTGGMDQKNHPLIKFVDDWNKSYNDLDNVWDVTNGS